VDELTTPTNQVRFRFVVSDNGEDSQVEAAVDAVKVEKFEFAPLIITPSLPSWTFGAPYEQQLEAISCAGGIIWSDKMGSLEGTGLMISSAGLVSGTPLTTGITLFLAEAVDELGESDEHLYSFRINPALTIMNDDLPDAIEGLPYSCQLYANGGTGARTWTDRDGMLEGTGLSLTANGYLGGTPVDTGIIILIIRVEDEVGALADSSFVLTIKPDYDCGDANGDQQVNVADAVYIINYVFKEGSPPVPIESGDANCDHDVNVGDAVYVINYVFNGGPEPCCP
jgi:hypothetical protein